MPVSFLTQAQVQSYGRYHEAPTPEQLARFFHLNESERHLSHPSYRGS